MPGEWLYAVGDITGRALLTHMGKYQGRIGGAVIAARAEGRPIDGPSFTDVADAGRVPQVTFTDPQVASVGVTEKQARDAGADVETVEADMAAVAGVSLLRDGYVGRAKLVIDSVHRTPCWAQPSSAPRSPSSCTPRPWQWSAGSPWSSCGTSYRRTRR